MHINHHIIYQPFPGQLHWQDSPRQFGPTALLGMPRVAPSQTRSGMGPGTKMNQGYAGNCRDHVGSIWKCVAVSVMRIMMDGSCCFNVFSLLCHPPHLSHDPLGDAVTVLSSGKPRTWPQRVAQRLVQEGELNEYVDGSESLFVNLCLSRFNFGVESTTATCTSNSLKTLRDLQATLRYILNRRLF